MVYPHETLQLYSAVRKIQASEAKTHLPEAQHRQAEIDRAIAELGEASMPPRLDRGKTG